MRTLMDAIAEHGAELVESAVWESLDELGDDRRAIIAKALAVDGVDGLVDLLLAGPALGGPDDDELAALLVHLPDAGSRVAYAA